MCILRILLDAKFVRHRREREEMESEIVNEIENKFYDDNEQDENDHADEYIRTFVNECNKNDEPVSKPAISYPTYDLPDVG